MAHHMGRGNTKPLLCIVESRTGVQRGLDKWFDGSLLILEWVKVQILQLGRKEKTHIKMGN